MRRVSVFGSTGSVGQNTIDLIQRAPDAYEVVALTGAGNIGLLASDAKALRALRSQNAPGPTQNDRGYEQHRRSPNQTIKTV